MNRRSTASLGVLLRWWYASIGIGFLLLALRAYLAGDLWWRVGLRVVIAVGFLLLSRAYWTPKAS